MFLFLAFIAGMWGSSGWLCFWIVCQFFMGRGGSAWLLISALVALLGHPELAAGILAVIWAVGVAKETQRISMAEKEARQGLV